MSHISKIALEVHDLDSLRKAAEACGLEFREGQRTFRWFGRSVGDYPLPRGFTEADMGRCEHALSVPSSPTAYEVGVVRRRDGEGYVLLWDFWLGGFGLEERVGKNAAKLLQEYARFRQIKEFQQQGFVVDEAATQYLPDGTLVVECVRQMGGGFA